VPRPGYAALPVQSDVLRLIDANFNRAREGLRVIEDFARFVRNDDELVERLKRVRHAVATALSPLLAEAVLHRDVSGDVGTTISTQAESERADLHAVVAANARRVPEALRAIEECSKTIDPAIGQAIERVRYDYYAIEQRLLATLRPADRFAAVRLYVLVTESACKRSWLVAAEQAILGGADCLQLREKSLDGGELLRRATLLVDLCRAHRTLCIVNDRADVARLSRADGVHVGQTDLPCSAARTIVGVDAIVGVSTHEVAQARRAELDGADYIGVGPVYRSETKPREFVAGLDYARDAARAVKIPTVAIAGITPDNAREVLSTGVRSVAVTACVMGADDVRGATRRLKDLLTGVTA
jgi:thiamine-phosphate pyrophosphorylase